MTQMKTSSYEMKVAIIANGKPQSRRVASKLFNAFRDDPDFYLTKKNPDVVISIGGDGMLLSAFHMYEKELARVRFVGIHTGHLGFYTDYLDSEVNQLIETLRKDNGDIRRPASGSEGFPCRGCDTHGFGGKGRVAYRNDPECPCSADRRRGLHEPCAAG